MKQAQKIKQAIQEKYATIVEQDKPDSNCGCGCSDNLESSFSQDYSKLAGYNPSANFALGCGLPTEFVQIKKGDTVLDLGSGAGNDVFVARALVGETGRVIGVDMTTKMIEKARENAAKLGHQNIEFKLGEIENLPVSDETVDVVVSNCVINLVPNKEKVFAEIFRALKKGGHFSISDVTTTGKLPEGILNDMQLYVGCVAGAISKEDYLQTIKKSGFENIRLQQERKNEFPETAVKKLLSEENFNRYQKGEFGLLSVTVYAEKPVF